MEKQLAFDFSPDARTEWHQVSSSFWCRAFWYLKDSYTVSEEAGSNHRYITISRVSADYYEVKLWPSGTTGSSSIKKAFPSLIEAQIWGDEEVKRTKFDGYIKTWERYKIPSYME